MYVNSSYNIIIINSVLMRSRPSSARTPYLDAGCADAVADAVLVVQLEPKWLCGTQ